MNGEQEVKISGPGNLSGTVRGHNVLLPVVLALALAASMALQYRNISKLSDMMYRQHLDIRAHCWPGAVPGTIQQP